MAWASRTISSRGRKRGPGCEAEDAHEVVAVQEPWGLPAFGLGRAVLERVGDAVAVRLPLVQREVGAARREEVGKAQVQGVHRVVFQLSEEAVERPRCGDFALLGELAGAQMALHNCVERADATVADAQALQQAFRHLGAQGGVTKEADATGGLRSLGLGLGHVVEEAGELEPRRTRVAVAQVFGEVVVQPRLPGDAAASFVLGAEIGVEDALHHGGGLEAVVEDVPVVLHRLGDAAGGRKLRESGVQKPQPVEQTEMIQHSRLSDDGKELVPYPLGGRRREAGSGLGDEALRVGLYGEAELGRKAHGAETADGVRCDGIGAHSPQDAVSEVRLSMEGVDEAPLGR